MMLYLTSTPDLVFTLANEFKHPELPMCFASLIVKDESPEYGDVLFLRRDAGDNRSTRRIASVISIMDN